MLGTVWLSLASAGRWIRSWSMCRLLTLTNIIVVILYRIGSNTAWVFELTMRRRSVKRRVHIVNIGGRLDITTHNIIVAVVMGSLIISKSSSNRASNLWIMPL